MLKRAGVHLAATVRRDTALPAMVRREATILDTVRREAMARRVVHRAAMDLQVVRRVTTLVLFVEFFMAFTRASTISSIIITEPVMVRQARLL